MKLNQYYIFLAILIVVIISYLPGLNAYFVNDDYNWLKPVNINEIISSFWGSWGHGALYRPLTRLLLYIEFLFFGSNPIGFHLISALLHSLALYIFYQVILKYFENTKTAFMCLFFSLFFYPFHEAVAWISTQTVLLGTVFSLLCFNFSFTFYANKKRYNYVLALLFFILALMSYESTIISPFIILSLLILGSEKPGKEIRSFLEYMWPFIILIIIYLIFRNHVLQGLPQANDITFKPLDLLINYLRLINNQIYLNKWVLGCVIISVFVLFALKLNYKYYLTGVLWFILGYLPFTLVNGYTGRFAYFSMFGLFILLGYCSYQLVSRNKWLSYAVIGLLVLYAGKNTFETNRNSFYWYEAGEIARLIPVQLKNMHSGFPDNSTLIFFDIPLSYKQSGVFLTYFEDAVQSQYNEKLKIIHVSHPFNRNLDLSIYENQPNTYKFKYFLDERQLKELK